MILELEEPFRSKWRKGYIRTSAIDGRRRVDLFNSNTDRTTISYSRYLVSVKLKRILEEFEEVDHIDGDSLNDDLSNLQVLSKPQHLAKTTQEVRVGRLCVVLQCPECSVLFTREVRNLKGKLSFCSKTCSTRFHKTASEVEFNEAVGLQIEAKKHRTRSK